MKMNLHIQVEGRCSYANDREMEDHLAEVVADITRYAESLVHESYYRKIQLDYETQEALDDFNIMAIVGETE